MEKDITIRSMQSYKKDCGVAIRKAVLDFYLATGLEVVDVEIVRDKMCDGTRVPIRVELKVEL